MAMEGRRLTRDKVLDWMETWSYTDRQAIIAALDVIPNGVFVVPPFGGYIGVWVNGRRGLVIYPGYLDWPGGRWAKDLPPHLFPRTHVYEGGVWHELSTFRPNTGERTTKERAVSICPRHDMALPLTGVCDDCG
jgi:hypothetical protein